MLTSIYRSAAAWTALGLASGLGYRELTRQLDFTGFTQLALAHTHALALGTLVLLIGLGLTKVFALDTDRRLGWWLWAHNIGLAITFGMLIFKGTLQVLGSELATSKALAGVSGLGHMILTGGFVLLLLVLGRATKTVRTEPVAVAETASVG